MARTVKVCISSFLENMNHEFPNSDITISRRGYKVDGDLGIKYTCNYMEYKSVDYFKVVDGEHFTLIEFSDLIAQNKQLETRMTKIKASDLEPDEKRRLRKSLNNTINRELVSKFKDSIFILGKLKEDLDNIPLKFDEKPKYLIVVAPFDSYLGDTDKIDIARFLEMLKDKLLKPYLQRFFLE